MGAAHIRTSGGRFESTRTVGADVIDAQALKTYKIRFGEHNFVMRSKPGPVAKLLPTAHAIECELRVLSALGTMTFRSPGCMHCVKTNQ